MSLLLCLFCRWLWPCTARLFLRGVYSQRGLQRRNSLWVVSLPHVSQWVDSSWSSFISVVLVIFAVRAIVCKTAAVISRTVFNAFRLIFFHLGWRHWFLYCPEFLQWSDVGSCFSGIGFVVGCVNIVFTRSSSGASIPFSSKSSSTRITMFCYMPFSKWSWFVAFFVCNGLMAQLNFSMMAGAALS